MQGGLFRIFRLHRDNFLNLSRDVPVAQMDGGDLIHWETILVNFLNQFLYLIIYSGQPGKPRCYYPSVVSMYLQIQDVFPCGRVYLQRLVIVLRYFPCLGDTQCFYSCSERLQVHRDVSL